MKLFRNSVLICLCLVLALTIAGCGGSSKSKTSNPGPQVGNDPTIQVSLGYNDQFIVSRSSVFDVPVIITRLPEKGINALSFSINYDSNVLEFVNLTPASMVTDLSEFNYYAEKIGIITLTYTPEDSFVTSDGLFVTVKMKVKDDAVPGNYQLIAENGERGSFHTIIYENGKVKENVWHYVYYKPAAVVVK